MIQKKVNRSGASGTLVSNRSTGILTHKKSTGTVPPITQSVGTFTAKEYKFTIATITMDLIFLCFYVPVSVNLTLNIVDTFTRIFNTPLAIAQYRFYSNVSQLIAFTYHSIIIFIFYAFNQFFRAELISILRLNKIMPLIAPSTSHAPDTGSIRFS